MKAAKFVTNLYEADDPAKIFYEQFLEGNEEATYELFETLIRGQNINPNSDYAKRIDNIQIIRQDEDTYQMLQEVFNIIFKIDELDHSNKVLEAIKDDINKILIRFDFPTIWKNKHKY